MGKIKGLIINGEWLGNNLIVTPALQELNNISQVIVKEFIIKINEFNKEEEYQIVSYSFVSSDTILINFDSTNYVGAVEMQFAKQGATIVLIDSKVRVSNKNQINDDNLQKSNFICNNSYNDNCLSYIKNSDGKIEVVNPITNEYIKLDVENIEDVTAEMLLEHGLEVYQNSGNTVNVSNSQINNSVLQGYNPELMEKLSNMLDQDDNSENKNALMQILGMLGGLKGLDKLGGFGGMNFEDFSNKFNEKLNEMTVSIVNQVMEKTTALINKSGMGNSSTKNDTEQSLKDIEDTENNEVQDSPDNANKVAKQNKLKAKEKASEVTKSKSGLIKSNAGAQGQKQSASSEVANTVNSRNSKNVIHSKSTLQKEQKSEQRGVAKKSLTFKQYSLNQKNFLDDKVTQSLLIEFYTRYREVRSQQQPVPVAQTYEPFNYNPQFITQYESQFAHEIPPQIQIKKRPLNPNANLGFRIFGSNKSITAAMTGEGVFVSGKKVYRWGDPLRLDE